MKLVNLFLLFYLIFMALPGWSQTNGDQQFHFAFQLMEEGDKAYSLLEFKRFLFLYKNHEKTPDALFYTAELYLNYVGDLKRARSYYKRLNQSYPWHILGRKARNKLDFIETNSDYEGIPLKWYFEARASVERRLYDKGAERFRAIYETYPYARLADDAIIELVKLYLQHMNRGNEAMALLRKLRSDYPNSQLLPASMYWEAVAIELTKGPGTEALSAYERVMETNPDSRVREMAVKRYKKLLKKVDVIKRRFDKESVRSYRVIRQGYSPESRTIYKIEIEIERGISERSIKATLEDALIKNSQNRERREHSVMVIAYYEYPGDKAGNLRWGAGEEPVYQIERRRPEDVFKDIFIDIFR